MNFIFSINNFFFKKNSFKNIFLYFKRITKNKFIEFEISKSNWFLFKIDIELSFRGKDHAGFRFEFVILGLEFSLYFYDCRHWNYDKSAWEL
jgi:hypothetical protein